MTNNTTTVITEQEARQLEQGLEKTRTGRLDAFAVMMQTDNEIKEDMKNESPDDYT